MKHYNIRVSGKVQGVWFRKFTQEKALSLGLRGFVRNEADGSVYMETEGEEGVVAELIAWCKEGPDKAEVTEVKFEEGIMKYLGPFMIAR